MAFLAYSNIRYPLIMTRYSSLFCFRSLPRSSMPSISAMRISLSTTSAFSPFPKQRHASSALSNTPVTQKPFSASANDRINLAMGGSSSTIQIFKSSMFHTAPFCDLHDHAKPSMFLILQFKSKPFSKKQVHPKQGIFYSDAGRNFFHLNP